MIISSNDHISIYSLHRNEIPKRVFESTEFKTNLEKVMKMNHVGIMVGDMDKAVEFYTKALGLRVVMNNTKVMET